MIDYPAGPSPHYHGQFFLFFANYFGSHEDSWFDRKYNQFFMHERIEQAHHLPEELWGRNVK